MSKAVESVLIVGGGFSGMSAAIELRKQGIDVELVEIDPKWAPLGAGISLGPPTMRALDTIGVGDQVAKMGFCSSGLDMRTHEGHPIAQIPTPKPENSEREEAGILRPVLAGILADATKRAGVKVRLGQTFEEITDEGDSGVSVTFTDGSAGRYDLVIGADGLHSKIRTLIFPDHQPPAYTKQACWRAVLDRPKDIKKTTMWLGPVGKVGAKPISDDKMYMFITEYRETDERPDPNQWRAMMADLIKPFPAPELQALLSQFEEDVPVDFRPLFNLLLPLPWHKSRIVLIGDAVHATTPHLASGAGIGIESAIVLAEELGQDQSLESALANVEERRWERCRMVVENSARLVEIENARGDKAEHSKIVIQSLQELTKPIS